MKKLFILVLLGFNIQFIISQEIISPSSIKWYTLEQAIKLTETAPRPIMLDVYTDWCTWCKFMMTTTFANKGIADYINNNFYAARFNAETFDTVVYKGRKYFNRRVGNHPSHDLASILLDGHLNYPTLVFFDRDGNKLSIPGYKESKDIEPILVYFAENVNKSATLDDFYINFMFAYPDAFKADHSIYKIDNNLKPDTLGGIDWIKPGKLLALQKKKPKPFGVFFYTDWSISSRVMDKTSFRDKVLSDKLNLTHYMIKINAASIDTIDFLGKKYFGNGVNVPNQLAYAFLNNNFQMPALVIFDEKNSVKGVINGFWAKNQLLPLFDFFYTGANLKMTFQEYVKSVLKPQ